DHIAGVQAEMESEAGAIGGGEAALRTGDRVLRRREDAHHAIAKDLPLDGCATALLDPQSHPGIETDRSGAEHGIAELFRERRRVDNVGEQDYCRASR